MVPGCSKNRGSDIPEEPSAFRVISAPGFENLETRLIEASPPKDTITQLAECLLQRADRYRLREVRIHESDGAPDEKERRPKHQPLGYQACMMAQ